MNTRRRIVLLLACALLISGALATERVKRPMHIHRVMQLGLEIWTEFEPQWDTQLTHEAGRRPIFTAETPGSTYPPAGMSWAVPGMEFSATEFESAARAALRQAAANYGVSERDSTAIELKAARYGELLGYEAEFSALANGSPVDVKVFFGHQPGKPAVAMQAFTLRGKLAHISEQIRRSWTNTRYLKQGGSDK